MIILTKRQKNILFFLASLNTSITIETIANKFDVSERTIRNDLSIIEDFLHGYNIKIIRKSNVGIYLQGNKNDLILLSKKLNLIDYRVLDCEERHKVIALLLLCSKDLTFDKIAKACLVSKQTIIYSFKDIEDTFKDNNIEIVKSIGKGISIKGKEKDFLHFFEKLVEISFENELIINSVINHSNLLYYEKEADKLLSVMGNNKLLSQPYIKKIKLIICFMIFRIKKYRLGAKDENYLNEQDKQYLDELIKRYVRNIAFSKEENELAIYLIDRLQTIQKINDENKEYFIQGLSNHLKLAIYRVKNNIKIENELLSQIKINIPLIYEFTKRELSGYKKLQGIEFNENEIAYISMYLASAYEKSIEIETTLNVILVCGFGLATATILKTRILNILPNCNIIGPMSEIEAQKYVENNTVDLAICTTNCYLNNTNMVSVNPLINSEDIEVIKNRLFQISYSQMCEKFISGYARNGAGKKYISDLVQPDCIQIIEETDSWEDAIKLAAKPLLAKKLIENRYVIKMIDAVKNYGTYMVLTNGTAFVHAGVEDGIVEDCTSILVVKREFVFGEKNQKTINNIVILGIKNKTDNPLIDLIYIFEKEDNINCLKSNQINLDIINRMHN